MGYVTCVLTGRGSNQALQIATTIAYAKRHNLEWFIPTKVGGSRYIYFKMPAKNIVNKAVYNEPYKNGNPYYKEIPLIQDVTLNGYFQSYKYFDDQREEVLKAFNIPYLPNLQDVVGIQIRRGDYITYAHRFPPVTDSYIEQAINYFKEKGYSKFYVISDGMEWCKEHINSTLFPNCEFQYSSANDDVKGYHQDIMVYSSCAHQIISASSLGYWAHWLNRNPDKICVCPHPDNWFKEANLDMLPENFVKIKY